MVGNSGVVAIENLFSVKREIAMLKYLASFVNELHVRPSDNASFANSPDTVSVLHNTLKNADIHVGDRLVFPLR